MPATSLKIWNVQKNTPVASHLDVVSVNNDAITEYTTTSPCLTHHALAPRPSLPPQGTVTALAYSGDGRLLAAALHTPNVQQIDGGEFWGLE